MVRILKSEAGSMFLLDFLAQKRLVEEKISLLEHTHGCSFEIFEKGTTSPPERFDAWDDLIEWRALRASLSDLDQKIAEVERGEFTLA